MSTSGSSARDEAVRLLREGAPADSVNFLLEAISDDPKDVDGYLYLGYAYAQLQDMEKAIDILEKAVDVSPASPKVHYNLGIAYQKTHNITQAKDEFLRALGLDPSYSVAKQALDYLTTDHGESADVV